MAFAGLCGLAALLWPAPCLAQNFPSTYAEQPVSMPWWDDYPLITQADQLATVQSYHSTVSFGGGLGDPTWGIYFDRTNDNPGPINAIHQAGLKVISYYETFGQITEVAGELAARGSLDYTPIYRSHWSWSQPDLGGPIAWAGPQNYFDDEAFAQPWTRTHPRYGGPQMTYPDGTIATGYMSKYPPAVGSTDPASNPYNSRVLDACASKDILGNYQGAADPPSGGTTRGLVQAEDTASTQSLSHPYVSHISIGKDIVCPFWDDFQRASILFDADRGLDGIWTDNYSAYDSFCFPPVYGAFGEWSVAKFRDYLAAHFTSAQITAMGVSDLPTFDIRTNLRAKMVALGGNDTQVTYQNTKWNDVSWLDDPIWRAYKIYRRQTGTEGLTNWYNATKTAAAEAGKPDFLIAGNDIPFYSLGWVRGNLDMVSAEMTPGFDFGTTTRGITLPPVGRFAPVWKLGRECAKSRLINLWMYVDGAYSGSQNHAGIANVLEYEMLGNSGSPLVYPSNPNVAGTVQSHIDYFNFVASCKPTFHMRMPVTDVGLLYSSSSVLYFVTPGSYQNMNAQPHQLAYYGWGTALGELHYQYRAIPEWKLNADILKNMRVLIVPNADVLDKSDVDGVIDPWVRAGGLLIVTGNSGNRKNEAGNFDVNPAGFSLAGLTGVAVTTSTTARKLMPVGSGKVLYLGDNIGMNYFNNYGNNGGDLRTVNRRPAHLTNDFKKDMDDILSGVPPVVLTTDAPTTIGVNMFEDARARRLFIDVNNEGIKRDADGTNVTSDVPLAAAPINFTIQLPDWLKNVPRDKINLKVMAPGTPPAATLTLLANNQAQVTLGPIQFYASVVIERPKNGLNQAKRWQQYP